MQKLLFTMPDAIAQKLKKYVEPGQRSRFIIKHIAIPLRYLEKKKKNGTRSPYKASFLKALRTSEKEAAKGKVYSHEEVMKKFGLL